MSTGSPTWKGWQRGVAAAVLCGMFVLPFAVWRVAAHVRDNPGAVRTWRARWAGAEYLDELNVIRQKRSNDCGPACLRMALSTIGVTADEAALSNHLRPGPAGVSMLALLKAAQERGVDAAAWKLGLRELAGYPGRAIAYVDGNHFVVVDRVSPTAVWVRDPARGRLCYTTAAFQRHWQGQVLLLAGSMATRRRQPETR